MTRREKAVSLFNQGYNCCQAVLLAFEDRLNLPASQAAALAAPFGGGMGRLREVCGTFSGMLMALGLLKADPDPKNTVNKAEIYAQVQKLAAEFKERNGSIVCRELLGLPAGPDAPAPAPRTPQYYQKRPCAELIGDAAEMLERLLDEQKA